MLSDAGFAEERLPRIQRFTMVEPYHFEQYSSQQWRLLNVHELTKGPDNMRGTSKILTKSYPVWPTSIVHNDVYGPYHFILRRCLHSNSTEDAYHQCLSSDIVSSSVAINDALEGINGWVSGFISNRQPCYLTPSSAIPTLAHPKLLSKQQFEQHYSAHRARKLSKVVSPRTSGNIEAVSGVTSAHLFADSPLPPQKVDSPAQDPTAVRKSSDWSRSKDFAQNMVPCLKKQGPM